jgi:hypothetical protein
MFVTRVALPEVPENTMASARDVYQELSPTSAIDKLYSSELK